MRRTQQTVWCCNAHTPAFATRRRGKLFCAQTMSDWSDKSDWSDLSAAFAADTTIVDMRITTLPFISTARLHFITTRQGRKLAKTAKIFHLLLAKLLSCDILNDRKLTIAAKIFHYRSLL
jgi:hypothetical protein